MNKIELTNHPKAKTEGEIINGFTANWPQAMPAEMRRELEDELRAEINHADHNNPKVD